MNPIHPGKTHRPGMTLIEILVVIAIIAILASLILGGVMVFLRKGPEVKNRNDILQLSEGLHQFYAEHKFYPPDKIKLYSNLSSYNSTNPLDARSLSYIGAIWPNINRGISHDWSGTGTPVNGVILEGDQCLVFFLGGIPQGNQKAPRGFSNDPTSPTAATVDRKKYFSFESARCDTTLHADATFPAYLDAHAPDLVVGSKKPFIYFGSSRGTGGYPNIGAIYPNSFSVSPYVENATSPVKYWNHTTFQIISAGPDGQFGKGGPWTPGTPPSSAGKDDVSNFHDRALGS